MTPTLETAEYVSRYTIHVRFADGIEGDIDLSRTVGRGVRAFEGPRRLPGLPARCGAQHGDLADGR